MSILKYFGLGAPPAPMQIPTDHAEEIIGLAQATQNRQIIERKVARREHQHDMDNFQKLMRAKSELHAATQEVKRLTAENTHLRDISTKLFTDRGALIRAIKQLGKRWVQEADQPAFLAQAQELREAEGDALVQSGYPAKVATQLMFNATNWQSYNSKNSQISQY